jgi:hypothetical protein
MIYRRISYSGPGSQTVHRRTWECKIALNNSYPSEFIVVASREKASFVVRPVNATLPKNINENKVRISSVPRILVFVHSWSNTEVVPGDLLWPPGEFW